VVSLAVLLFTLLELFSDLLLNSELGTLFILGSMSLSFCFSISLFAYLFIESLFVMVFDMSKFSSSVNKTMLSSFNMFFESFVFEYSVFRFFTILLLSLTLLFWFRF